MYSHFRYTSTMKCCLSYQWYCASSFSSSKSEGLKNVVTTPVRDSYHFFVLVSHHLTSTGVLGKYYRSTGAFSTTPEPYSHLHPEKHKFQSVEKGEKKRERLLGSVLGSTAAKRAKTEDVT
uniref:Uncharacterized protein n=1 Tax=Palpitomonas bilix TaxID=652834 RepID=A0A7S3GH35_9EUKA|mmetsp:Transcript_49087/g.126804  ORF Transcript_49087/g.126804 Transcript_49087/m.126804 type:complete len:121 (+) Transcript_49087:2-364(+)